MSLQVWLPLTKDLRNQGLDNIAVTTANTNNFQNEGKLSNKSLDVSGHYAFRVPSLIKKRVFSCAFWYKPITDSSLSDNWRRIIVFETYTSDGSTAGAIFRFESSYGYQSSNPTYCISIHNNVGEPIASIGTSLGETDGWNKWQHIAITADGVTLKCYRNGVQVASGNMGNGGMLQGTVHIGYSGNRPIGRLNDFRLYDHCLSEKEVKELSKGLVLHYPLNRQGWGQENLLLNTNTPATWSQGVNSSNYAVHDCFKTQSPVPSLFSVDELITISFDWSTTATGGNFHVECGAVTPWVWGTVISSKGTRNSASNYIDITSSNQSGHVEITFKITSNQTGAADTLQWLRIRHDGADTANKIFTISNAKLERGSIATPWCPNSSDALATTVGLNGTTEYDCSGFGNNGTKNNISYTSDTPKYAVSSIFNGSNSYIKVNDNNWMVKGMSEMTVNLWAKATTWPTNGGKLVSCTESGGFNLEAGNSGYWRFPIYVYTNSEQTSSAYKYDSNEIKIANLIPNEWNMITLVYETTGTKTYINGELHHTYTNTSYGINFNTNARLFLGCEASTANPTSPYFNGKECDFRIYTTALSADDIKSLYNNNAYIDTAGNIYGKIR